MKLIDEIIELLSSNEPNLTTALLKTKVLLHKLGAKELSPWVDSELKGYQDSDTLPSYRVLDVVVRGNISNSVHRYPRHTLPVSHLKTSLREALSTTQLRNSIAVIEDHAKRDQLHITIAPEFYPYLSEGIGESYHVESAWGEHGSGAMTQVTIEVTTRLMNFVLELSEKIPDELENTDIREKSKEIGVSDIFKNAVFGDNATIVVGDSNSQNVKNSIIKNDLTSLQNTLKENGVSEEDLQELAVVIQADEDCKEIKHGSFGQHVSTWMGSMITKAASTAWDIKVGAAGSLLATAIGKYYGF